MARKQATRELRTPVPVGIGAGITEKYYLQHLRNLKGYKLKLMPRFFGSDNAYDMDKLVSDVLAGGAKAICVYDKDVTQWNEEQKHRLSEFEQKYARVNDVVLCPSMPSIEYWFLMHFRDTTKIYRTSKEVINDLHPFLPGYEKTMDYLRKEGWVKVLLQDESFARAITLSEREVELGHPYSKLAKAIKYLETI